MAGDDLLPCLSDGVIHLRGFTAADAAALAAIWQDAAIRARNTVPVPTTAAAREWVEIAAARAVAGTAWEWAIVDARSGELAGRRALKAIDLEQRCATAASWVAPAFRGRRFAARSLRLAAAHAFARGLERIRAECETDNPASLRSLIAAGMRLQATLPAHLVSNAGIPVDAHILGLAPDDLASAPSLI